VNGVYGVSLVCLFVVLQAPDPALSMLVVSGIGYPLVMLAAIARSRGEDRKREEDE
jgi:energy-converting hydrogenase B subunit D